MLPLPLGYLPMVAVDVVGRTWGLVNTPVVLELLWVPENGLGVPLLTGQWLELWSWNLLGLVDSCSGVY